MTRASLAFVVLLASCSALVDLSPFEVETWPSTQNQVLAAGDRIRITYSEPVEQTSAQALLSVSSVDGVAAGDVSWSGRTLTFTPVPALVRSKRYNLEYSGQVTLSDGRRFNIKKQVPFFSETSEPGLLLSSYSPKSGATATVAAPIVLTFDQPVEPASFTQGFSVSPTAAFTTAWSNGNKTATISPLVWASNTLVSWRLATSVKSAAGLPLAAAVSYQFLTNADQDSPVISLLPAVPVGSDSVGWAAAGNDLNALQKGDALLLTSSEPVSLPSLAAGLHLTPAVKGHWIAQNTTAALCEYVYVLEDGWSPGTSYSLQLSGVQDLVGNLAASYLASFTPAIPYLQVTGITLTGVSSTAYVPSDLNRVNVFPACKPSVVAGTLQIAVTITFSENFSASDKTQFAQVPFCQTLFPTEGTTLATPSLVTVSFNSDSSAVLSYQGFSVGTALSPNYYRIRVPGGSSGLRTQAGNVLKEDVWLGFTTGF